jgi:ATPase family associated with various cellular activities (AAA)/Winged helix domain, variant
MNSISICGWEEANQAYLTAALTQVRTALVRFLALSGVPVTAEEKPAFPTLEETRAAMPVPPALETLSATFGLSNFERKILVMCAGVELDSNFRSILAAALREHRPSLPTFSLALAAFEDAHWSALLPERPLRYWRLVDFLPGDALTTSPLRIDESILHYLAGLHCADERLRGLTEPLRAVSALTPSQQAVAAKLASVWSRADREAAWPAVQLCGCEVAAKRAVAVNTCAALGMELRLMPAAAVPRSLAELELFVRLWEREAALSPSGLLLECDELDATDIAGEAAVKRLIETVRNPLLVSVRERRRPVARSLLWFQVARPVAAEQSEIWKQTLGEAAPAFNGTLEKLVSQFSLSAEDIRTAAAQAMDWTGPDPAASISAIAGEAPPAYAAVDLASAVWDACRAYARPRLEGLAQRIEPAAAWDDLVLPERQKQLLKQIALHVRQRSRVYEGWGFASKGARGLGISALFAGPSGTGKTMAGEVLANELRLDLYRIDLSQVVSKYIGETEKNLRRVFDAADEGAAILLFDEADALFGKRSEVKDSHDRYANIEVSYLLQRMEAYRGLAILTTNRKDALDTAFLRRIRFAVDFPFPDAAQRAEIWRQIFPPQTPTEGLRFDRLASLNAAGGHIRNIALGAAFLAADAAEPVRMPHLLQAARVEFAKLERPLTESETARWV